MFIRVRQYLLLGIFAVTALMLWLHFGVAFSGDKTEKKLELSRKK